MVSVYKINRIKSEVKRVELKHSSNIPDKKEKEVLGYGRDPYKEGRIPLKC